MLSTTVYSHEMRFHGRKGEVVHNESFLRAPGKIPTKDEEPLTTKNRLRRWEIDFSHQQLAHRRKKTGQNKTKRPRFSSTSEVVSF